MGNTTKNTLNIKKYYMKNELNQTIIKMQFDPNIAKEVGVEEAIMYANIEFWCKYHQKNNTNYYDKRHWMNNSEKAFTEFFPFWSEKQIKKILSNLYKKKYIVIGNYNKSNIDKTPWYALANEIISIDSNESIETTQIIQAIPDNKQQISDIYKLYSEKINSKSRLTNSAKKKIMTRLKEFSSEDLKRAIMNFSRASWWMKNNARRGVTWFFHTEDRIDQFLNLEAEDKKEKLNL